MGTPADRGRALTLPPHDAAAGKCYDVAVIGGGVIGHGIAWEARRSGRSVALIDDAPGTGASWAAAGMLAPVSELHYQEEDLLELMLESSRLWPDFAAGARRIRRTPGRDDRVTSRRRPSPWAPTPPTAGRSRTCANVQRRAGLAWSR